MGLDERLKRAEIHFIGTVAKEIDLGVDLNDKLKESI
jgi:hydrogenase maturation protease